MTRLPLYVGFALGLAVTAYPLAAQTGSVEGTVTAAATREPVVGAEVTIAGSNIGVRTGSDGRFALRNVPAGPREVRVLAIGYRLATLRLTVSADQVNQTSVQLTPSVLQLDAVVVTGTAGLARVREVGNSIAQVNLSQVKDPPANMDQLLQARAPGLSGMPSRAARVRRRGRGTAPKRRRACSRPSRSTAARGRPAGRSRRGRVSPSCARSAPTPCPISTPVPQARPPGCVTRTPPPGAPGSETPTGSATPGRWAVA